MSKRKYIPCRDFSEEAISAAALQLVNELFALEVRKPARKIKTRQSNDLENAEKTISNYARAFREEIYPYRRQNPIAIKDLFLKFKDREHFGIGSPKEMMEVLMRLKQSHMLPGYYFDDEYAFLANERVDQKRDLNVGAKKAIARAAARKIESDMTIALDSGSTTSELANELCGLIETRIVHGLRVVTTSIPAASCLLDCLNRMESSDRDTSCRVFLVGGLCRAISL